MLFCVSVVNHFFGCVVDPCMSMTTYLPIHPDRLSIIQQKLGPERTILVLGNWDPLPGSWALDNLPLTLLQAHPSL